MGKKMGFLEATDRATQVMVVRRTCAVVYRDHPGWRVSVELPPHPRTPWQAFWVSVFQAATRKQDPQRVFWNGLGSLGDQRDASANAALAEVARDELGMSQAKDTFFVKSEVTLFQPVSQDMGEVGDSHREPSYYTPDWPQISNNLRIQMKWKCETCGITLSTAPHLLHVHHIDFNPQNNVRSNLRVLCALCHSHCKGHGHIVSLLSPRELEVLEHWHRRA